MTTQLGEGLTLHTDFYELNMMNTFFEQGISERNAVFEVFFRDLPFGSGFAVFAGLEHVMDYLNHLKFSEDDLAYLQSQTDYSDAFIDYLRHLKFTCTVKWYSTTSRFGKLRDHWRKHSWLRQRF